MGARKAQLLVEGTWDLVQLGPTKAVLAFSTNAALQGSPLPESVYLALSYCWAAIVKSLLPFAESENWLRGQSAQHKSIFASLAFRR